MDRVFYDGSCGLCHRSVRFALARDHEGRLFRFTPLQSQRFADLVPAAARDQLPDSIVVVTGDQRLLTRSDAVLHILTQVGHGWRALATVARIVPRPMRDAAYDGVALIRSRLFRRPDDVCPMVPPELRGRFEE